jgi:hypothetical protein
MDGGDGDASVHTVAYGPGDASGDGDASVHGVAYDDGDASGDGDGLWVSDTTVA